jgi:tetratricopeptide (TPR) repeat protein
MKIFISYGHDHNKPIVDRIERDLKAAGYEVWKDETEIKAGDHWRRSIVDGLKDSDWVLGFLSKHSVRDPGVCLDELGIALHEKGGAIATVLLEGEAGAPVSVSHIQWLDMHDWAERQTAGGAAFESWYRAKLDELLAALASPATQRFAGEIAELDRRLVPVSQAADIGFLVDGFVGREWLRARLDEWQRSEKSSRLFWLSGGAGSGKSAFAAWLAHHGKVNVIGINLCRYNDDDRRDAGRVLRTLAFQIATRLPDYRRLLLDRLKSQDPGGEEVKRKNPAGLFSWLLIEPLHRAIDGGRGQNRFLVVIDGLDETVRGGRSELTEILRADAQKLPGWIAIVVTSRPEEPIKRQFAGLQPVQIEAESAENLDDVRAYLRAWLATQNLPAEKAEALLGRIAAASEGNFLYLRMFRAAVTKGTLRLAAPEGLPQGLVGLYERWFRRFFPDRKAYEAYVPVLEVIAAAEHPVPEPWLSRMFGWSTRDAARMLQNLPSLFERRTAGVTPFHKSLRDWLVDPEKAGPDFVVDQAAGTRRLAEALWDGFREWAAQPDSGPLDSFCVVELPAQVAQLAAADVRHLPALEPWTAVRTGLFEVAKIQAAAYAWESALSWWRMTARLADAVGDVGRADQAYAFSEAGDILVTLGRSDHALKSFRDGLAMRERLSKADPSNAGWQRDVYASLWRVADVEISQGNLASALNNLRTGQEIMERLAKADPGNAGWQRDLSVSYERVGDVLVAHGNLPEALKSFRAGLAIADRLAQADPGNAGWQRDLSVSYDNIGDVQVAQGDLAGALKSYRDSLVIRERLAQSDPGNAGWQRDLSVSNNKVGDVLVAQGNLPEALKSFRAGLAIRDRLAKADPGNAQWQRDLSLSYRKLAFAYRKAAQPAKAREALAAGCAIIAPLVAQFPDWSQWKQDLAWFDRQIAELSQSKGLTPGRHSIWSRMFGGS